MAGDRDPHVITKEEFKQLWGYDNLDFNDVDTFPHAREIMQRQILNNELFEQEFNGPKPCEGCGGRTPNSKKCLPYRCTTFNEGFECSPACHGNTCSNRRLSKGDYKHVMRVGASQVDSDSFGVFALEPIVKNQMIGEFIGVLKIGQELPANYCVQVGERLEEEEHQGSLLFLDAREEGDIARFIQSSCNPNCRFVTLICGQAYRVGVIATKSIAKMAELYVENPRLTPARLKCKCKRLRCEVRDAQPSTSRESSAGPSTSAHMSGEPDSKKPRLVEGLGPIKGVGVFQPGMRSVTYPIPPEAYRNDNEEESEWSDDDEEEC